MLKHQRAVLPALAVVALSLLGAVSALASAHTSRHHAREHHSARPHSTRGRRRRGSSSPTTNSGGLPVNAIEAALQIKGTMSHGVLSEGFDRSDISNVTLDGVPIKPSFEINGEYDFQPLGRGQAFMNGDMPVKPSEVDPVITALVQNHIVFQAFHQHMYDFTPIVFFIHVRARGGAVDIARRLHNVLKATSTPLPQAPPSHPTTPLDPKRLESILHGFDYDVGSDGVVTVYVAPAESITIDGVHVNPRTNIMTNVSFEPLNASGTSAAVVPDFAQTAAQVMPLEQVMRVQQNWDVGCLYNQETDEHPQLYFSHMFKTGDPYQLAREIARGEAATGIH